MKRRTLIDGWNVKDDDDIDDKDDDNSKELSESVSVTKLVRTWLHSRTWMGDRQGIPIDCHIPVIILLVYHMSGRVSNCLWLLAR